MTFVFGQCCYFGFDFTTRKLLNKGNIYIITETTDQSREILAVIYTVQLTSFMSSFCRSTAQDPFERVESKYSVSGTIHCMC